MGWKVIVGVAEAGTWPDGPVQQADVDHVSTLDDLIRYLRNLTALARGQVNGYVEVEVAIPPRAGRTDEAQPGEVLKGLSEPRPRERNTGRRSR